MNYPHAAIADSEIPTAANPMLQSALAIYCGETNKVASVWQCFADGDLSFRPHSRASTALEILRHQLLSERRFFAEFLGSPEPPAAQVLPEAQQPSAFAARLVQLARPRLGFLASQPDAWWLAEVPFFDVQRQRLWIFWRRVLHTAHHRTQLTVYLRLLGKPVPSTYGPTADVSWDGADPTVTVEAAERR